MEGSSSIGEAYPTSQLDNSGRSRDSYYDDICHKASMDHPNQPNQQQQQQQQHDMYSRSNYQSNTSNNMGSMRSSGITSSHPSEATSSYNYSGTTNNSSSFRSRTTNTTTRTGPSYFQPMKKDISLSGNPLTHVQESPC